MRMIDADIADVVIIYDKSNELTQVSAIREYIERQKAFLDKFPTIDAVPVVRCRECKHFRHYGKTSLFINGKNIKAGWCKRRISYDEEYRMTADDFCRYGERKEGADNV